MKGGYQILILSAITLVADTETTITDLNILNQLLGLTDFLNKDGLVDKQLKPILLITKDSAGFVSITNPEYISGYQIKLNIVYTSSIDDYGNTVYAVSSAKYTYVLVNDNIKNIIESGEVDNAKPIYCHPIVLYNAGDQVWMISCLIFNQKAEAFTKETLITYLKTFTGRLVVTGSYDSASTGFVVVSSVNNRNDGIWLLGWTPSDSYISEGIVNFETVITNSSSFNDAVNKIN